MPLIILRKVVRAVKAFDKLSEAHTKFEELFAELNDSEEKEFTRLSGAKIGPSVTEQNKRLKEQIEKFQKIAVHIEEHCCDNCEDTTMCEFGCAVTELKASVVTGFTSHDGIGDSERAQSRNSLNCRNDETPSQSISRVEKDNSKSHNDRSE
jgi:hypothetical protein